MIDLEAVRKRRATVEDSPMRMIPFRAMRSASDVLPLCDEIERILTALRALRDEQNGPPLIRREQQWKEAMETATAILEEYDA